MSASRAGTSGDFKNVNQAFAIPLDISLPMPVAVPFSATFHQSILVQTMFTAQQATIRANGEYKFGGTLTAGIVNGSPSATAPLFVSTKQDLGNSMTGLSLGVNGLVIGYGGKFIVGIGALGMVVGPYASVNISAGITRGSDLQATAVGYTCRSSTLENVPWTMASAWRCRAWSVKAINTFLSIFHAKPISADYGHSLGQAKITTLSMRFRLAVSRSRMAEGLLDRSSARVQIPLSAILGIFVSRAGLIRSLAVSPTSFRPGASMSREK